jgi:hypothetical protein
MKKSPAQRLKQLLGKEFMVTMDGLVKQSQDRSRRSLFRDLAAVGYLSSYTHAGRYYTLPDIPRFDDEGLWVHRGVGFSRAGTLKATVVELVNASEAGRTHQELSDRVRVRVHNTLLELVRAKRIQREQVLDQYLYLSTQPEQATRQLALRDEIMTRARAPTPEPVVSVVIEVLSEVVSTARLKVDAKDISSRLCARGVVVAASEVERILESHGVEKKTGRRRS